MSRDEAFPHEAARRDTPAAANLRERKAQPWN